MTPRLLAQLGHVFLLEAEKVAGDPYAWPRREPTAWELDEATRLAEVAGDLFARAEALGFNGGADAAFGWER